MSYRLTIYPAAERDIDDAAVFIANDNLPAALRFYDAVDLAFQQIRAHPVRWPRYEIDHPSLANLRKRSVPRFGNYLIFYRIEGNVVEVIRVLHGARDIPTVLGDQE